jgi:polygalacturonase
VAPNAIWTTIQHENLLTFYRADNLTVDGSGQIDGRGAIWWTCFNQKVGCSAHNSLIVASLPLLVGNKLMSPLIFDRDAASGQL